MMELHPQVERLFEMMAAAGAKPVSEGTLEEARARPAAIGQLTGPGPEMAQERDVAIPVGGVDIRARLYSPATDRGSALVVYFHGGGWTVGQVSHFDGVCRRLADVSGAEVLSVGYRLAPEHRFPIAAEDAVMAVNWAADELGAGRRLVVAGDSSGANLAAVAARRARDAGGPEIALQALVYPVTDHDFESGSYREHGDRGLPLGAKDMRWFWDHYVPDVSDRDDPDAAPLRAADLTGLPPAIVIVAEYDPLRDEGLAYARRLEEAGVPVTLRHYSDVAHGFFTMAGFLDRGDEAINDVASAIGRVDPDRAAR